MPRYCLLPIVIAGGLALQTAAFGADPRFPDWPCEQVKVPEISLAAVWSGPSIDALESAWQADPAVRDLVARSAVRRTSLEDAQREIRSFIARSAEPALPIGRKRQSLPLQDCLRPSMQNAVR